MARYFDVHPRDPQPRSITQIAAMLRDDAVIAYPTDSCYALGCRLDNPTGADRIRRLRSLDDKHHFTLVCADFAQLGQLVQLDNAAFRGDQGGHTRRLYVHPPCDQGGATAPRAPQEADRRGAHPRPPRRAGAAARAR